jgi:hypothetical protein
VQRLQRHRRLDLHRVSLEKKLEQLPAVKAVLEEFIGREIMSWPLSAEAEFKASTTFSDATKLQAVKKDASAMEDVPAAAAVAAPAKLSNELDVSETEAERKEGDSSAAQRWNDLHKRIVQHNIRVIGGFYERITSARLSQLLQLEPLQTELLLSEMVSSKQLFAKIDRPAGVILFRQELPATEVLNKYANDLSTLLSVVEKTCHMINKENVRRKKRDERRERREAREMKERGETQRRRKRTRRGGWMHSGRR